MDESKNAKRVSQISQRLTEIYTYRTQLSHSSSEPVKEVINKTEFDERCRREQVEADCLRGELRQLVSAANAYMFDCSEDETLHLLVPNKEVIPEAAKAHCASEWKYKRWLQDFTGSGLHVGFYAEDALACINAQGYFIFRASWESTVIIPGEAAK